MPEELEPEEQREHQRRQEYGWFYDRLMEILYEHDPVGLIAFGAPKDEYSVEVDAFLPLLPGMQSPILLSQVLYEVFVQMFDEQMMRSRRAAFDSLAADVWNVFQQYTTALQAKRTDH